MRAFHTVFCLSAFGLALPLRKHHPALYFCEVGPSKWTPTIRRYGESSHKQESQGIWFVYSTEELTCLSKNIGVPSESEIHKNVRLNLSSI